jgi:hypothetical protein
MLAASAGLQRPRRLDTLRIEADFSGRFLLSTALKSFGIFRQHEPP